MEVRYRNITFREANGALVTRRVPTVAVPESFYDKVHAAWLKEHGPAGYVEYMHEVDEAFIASLGG